MPRFGLLLVAAAAAAVCGAPSVVQAQRVTPAAGIVGHPSQSCPRACIDQADQWKFQIWHDNECDAYRPESALSSGCRDFADKQASAYLTECQACCDTLYRWTHSCKPPQDTKYPPTVTDRVEVASPPATFTQSTPCFDDCTRMADGASAFCRERVKPRERRQCHALVAATHDQCQATCQSDRQVVKVNSVVGKSGYFTWPEGTCQFRCELENSDKGNSWINKCVISCPPCLPQVQEVYTGCMYAAGLAANNEMASEKAFCLNQFNEFKALCH